MGVLAVLDGDHPARLAGLDQVHRDVRERRRDHRVDRVGFAGSQVVGQLGRERLDPGPRPKLVCKRLADVRLVAMPEGVGLADVGHLGTLPDRAFGGDDERVVARVGLVVGGQDLGERSRGRTAPRG